MRCASTVVLASLLASTTAQSQDLDIPCTVGRELFNTNGCCESQNAPITTSCDALQSAWDARSCCSEKDDRDFWMTSSDVGLGTSISVPPGTLLTGVLNTLHEYMTVGKFVIQSVRKRPSNDPGWDLEYRSPTVGTIMDTCKEKTANTWACTMVVLGVPLPYTLQWEPGQRFAWVSTLFGAFAEWPSQNPTLFDKQ